MVKYRGRPVSAACENSRSCDLHFGSRNGGAHLEPAPDSREGHVNPEDPHSSDRDHHRNSFHVYSSGCSLGLCCTKNLHFIRPLVHIHTCTLLMRLTISSYRGLSRVRLVLNGSGLGMHVDTVRSAEGGSTGFFAGDRLSGLSVVAFLDAFSY